MRKLPWARCTHCGRMVTLKPEALVAIQAIGYTGSAVVPSNLRPHKCNHGNWCDECREPGRQR